VSDAGRRAALDAIAAEIRTCTRCPLHQGRTRAVPGEGHPDTEVMFVGEGPGFHEDQQGRPFVGQAGALLEELLRSVDWSRQEVFITNVVKCRPPGNRDPEAAEIAACAPFLTRQLEALDPALVVTLGRFSMARFCPGAKITQIHGTFRPADPSSGAGKAMTFAMYHPAAALRQASLKETLMRDMQGVPQALLAARVRRAGVASEPQPAGAEVAASPAGAQATDPSTPAPTPAQADSAVVQVAPAPSIAVSPAGPAQPASQAAPGLSQAPPVLPGAADSEAAGQLKLF
jgi:uracil-DNA glycosylase family 4